MYNDYFALAETPFRITPDPRYLWYSEQHQEAKNKILFHIIQSVGPIYLLADIGTGKTTIARRVMEELSSDQTKNVVFMFAAKLTTTNAFLRVIMDEFGVKTDRAYGKTLKNFEAFLLQQRERNLSPVLLIDEAQNMTRDMLLLIQHLFNFSTNTDFLIQMVLFAQPELGPKLNRLPSLKNRLSLARLSPFSREQTEEMLKFRWHVAGGKGFPFTPDAVDEIFRFSLGVPRSIVRIANEALIKAAVDNREAADRQTVLAATRELELIGE
jgi:general secretion pathway protein A